MKVHNDELSELRHQAQTTSAFCHRLAATLQTRSAQIAVVSSASNNQVSAQRTDHLGRLHACLVCIWAHLQHEVTDATANIEALKQELRRYKHDQIIAQRTANHIKADSSARRLVLLQAQVARDLGRHSAAVTQQEPLLRDIAEVTTALAQYNVVVPSPSEGVFLITAPNLIFD